MSIRKLLFSFSGRIPRRTYWLAHLGIWSALLIAGVIAGLIAGLIDKRSRSSTTGYLLVGMVVCVFWVSTLAVNVKRWHDRGKSGWWELIRFVPVIGPVWHLIELGFLEGTQGLNEFEEGYFAKDVLLPDDDPSLSASPIVGRQCIHCQQQIVSFMGAELCRACREPLHHDCCPKHLEDAHMGPPAAAYPR